MPWVADRRNVKSFAMNPHLIIDADVSGTGGTLLLEVAMGLRENRLRPKSLVWSTIPDQDQVKLLVELEAGIDHRLPVLVERFRGIPGVKKIVMNEHGVRPDPDPQPVMD